MRQGLKDLQMLQDLKRAEEERARGRRSCIVCTHLDGMSEEVRTALEAGITGTISDRKIADIMTRNGYPVGKTAILKHRKGHTS